MLKIVLRGQLMHETAVKKTKTFLKLMTRFPHFLGYLWHLQL